MKKILLIAIATAVMASSAYAAGKPMVMKRDFDKASTWKLVNDDRTAKAAATTEQKFSMKKGPAKAPTADGRPGTFVGRPAGSFYMGYSIGGFGYYQMEMYYMAPFVEQTFMNLTTEGDSYSWAYWSDEDYEAADPVPTQISTDKDLTLTFDGGFQYGPELTATNGVGDSTYVVDYLQVGGDIYENNNGNRFGAANNSKGWKDANGNYSLYYNPTQTTMFSADVNSYFLNDYGYAEYGVDTLNIKGFAEFFAKPVMPYLLSQVSVGINPDQAGSATLMIVKAEERTDNNGEIYYRPGEEVLCTAFADYTYEDGYYSNLLFSDLVYTDPDEGLESELIIEDPIFVIILPDEGCVMCPTWSPHASLVEEDNAFLVADMTMGDETFEELIDCNWHYSEGYANSWGMSLDITMNYLWSEDNTFEAPAEGGEKVFNLKSYYSTANWDIVTADGEDVDDLDWLSLDLVDSIYVSPRDGNQYFSGDVRMTVTAQALPEGVDSRAVDLIFTYPGGAKYVLHVTQGEGGQEVSLRGDVDGNRLVDLDDLNALINISLGFNTAAEYPGVTDLTGDGMVDVDDVNALINIILGLDE